jgi:hypothetical protein
MTNGPLPRRARAHPAHQHPNMNHYDYRKTPDNHRVSVSADRLRKWQAELQTINEIRQAIKSLSMPKIEKSKLLACTTHIGMLLQEVTGEIRQKLKVQ